MAESHTALAPFPLPLIDRTCGFPHPTLRSQGAKHSRRDYCPTIASMKEFQCDSDETARAPDMNELRCDGCAGAATVWSWPYRGVMGPRHGRGGVSVGGALGYERRLVTGCASISWCTAQKLSELWRAHAHDRPVSTSRRP